MLTGIEVLDLADEKASYCTKILALLGARVIKVEPPGGDPARRRGPVFTEPPHQESSISFCYNNTNKLGVTLNLLAPEGRQLFLKLIERSDVVVDSFPPRELKRLGCSYQELSALNPRLIHASVTGFGQHGPRSDYQSCDLVAAAFGGAMYVSGSPAGPPLKPWGEQSSIAGSLFAVLGILLALQRRGENGRGEYLDLSLQEAVASTLEHVLVRFFHDGVIAKRQGSRHWDDAFAIMPCRDGFLQMGIFQQWETLVEWMAGEGMAGDLGSEKWQDDAYRRSNREHIVEVIAKWTKSHTVDELFQLGQLMGFPWAPVQSPGEVLDSNQLKARDFFTPLHHEEMEEPVSYPGLPFRCSDIKLPPVRRAPSMGEDNVRIFRDEIGLSDEELAQLHASGII